MPFRRKRKTFSRRKFRRYGKRMLKGVRSAYSDITTIYNTQFSALITNDLNVGLDPSKYAASCNLIGQTIFRGSLNWATFASLYAYIKPLSITVQIQQGTITSATSYVNQGLLYYDKKARTIAQFQPDGIQNQYDAGIVYQGLLKNFGCRLLGSSNDSIPVFTAKFKIPFIQKMPIPEIVEAGTWDQQFGALYVMLDGRFPTAQVGPQPAFGTVRIMVHSRFYNRKN